MRRFRKMELYPVQQSARLCRKGDTVLVGKLGHVVIDCDGYAAYASQPPVDGAATALVHDARTLREAVRFVQREGVA
jgi:hypothetical protein